MTDISAILLFFTISVIIFWIGIFVFSSNPFDSLSRVGGILLLVLSLFLLSGAFLFSAHSVMEYRIIFKLTAFTVYLSAVLWFHASVLMLEKEKQKEWSVMITFGYLAGIFLSFLEPLTNLVINYDLLTDQPSRFKFIYAPGPLFFVAVGFIVLYTLLASYNFLKIRYLFPLTTSLLFLLGFVFIVSTFIFGHNRAVKELGENLIFLSVILLAVNVFLNRLFLDDGKPNLNKEFVYSSISILFIFLLYISLLLFFKATVNLKDLLFISILTFLILITHTTYDWLMSWARNIFYKKSFSIPITTDEEVNQAIRNYHRLERLEGSSLLRLNLIDSLVDGEKIKTSVDALRKIIKEGVDYFNTGDISYHRTKQNLKYYLLKLIAFDQAEEGQILWDLGFEEYPLEITRMKTRPPLFKISSASDYTATSRNAFINLKKEAIHDLAWRISYLENITSNFSRKNLSSTS